MRKFSFLIILFLLACSFSQAKIVDEQGKIVPVVWDIMNYFRDASQECSHDLTALNDYAQKKFLRPKGAERLDKEAISHYKQLCKTLSVGQKEKLLNIFDTLGYVDTVYPRYKEYDFICIQGSTVPTMRQRVMFLARLVNEKKLTITPHTQIVFLAGERKLFSSETPEVLLDTSPWEANPLWQEPDTLPLDEKEAALWVWEQLNLPPALREKPIVLINGKKRAGESRAQTIDAALEWVTMEAVRGKVLMISSNPYIPYQETVMKCVVKKANKEGIIDIEGCGCQTLGKVDIDVKLGLVLDTFARELHMACQMVNLPSGGAKETPISGS